MFDILGWFCESVAFEFCCLICSKMLFCWCGWGDDLWDTMNFLSFSCISLNLSFCWRISSKCLFWCWWGDDEIFCWGSVWPMNFFFLVDDFWYGARLEILGCFYESVWDSLFDCCLVCLVLVLEIFFFNFVGILIVEESMRCMNHASMWHFDFKLLTQFIFGRQ